MKINRFGQIVRQEWFKTAKLRPNVELIEDEFVVMPNHIHGIIWLIDEDDKKSNNQSHSRLYMGYLSNSDLPPVRAQRTALTVTFEYNRSNN